jgi:hypothetical protein
MIATEPKLPVLEALKRKVRGWVAVKDHGALPDTTVEDCLRFGADSIYETLRIPQMEFTIDIPVTESSNLIEENCSVVSVPEDLIEFLFVRDNHGELYDNRPDTRSFFDPCAELPWQGYMWHEMSIYVRPQLKVGDTVRLSYYRRLPAVDALYAVLPENFNFSFPLTQQPYLWLSTQGSPNATPLYFVLGSAPKAFSTLAEANQYASEVGGIPEQAYFIGKEAWHWLKNVKEQLLLNAALHHASDWLGDDKAAAKWEERFRGQVAALNSEERMRRAKGGAVVMHMRDGGLL